MCYKGNPRNVGLSFPQPEAELNIVINGNGPTSKIPLDIGGDVMTEEERKELGLPPTMKIERCKCCGNITYK